MTNLEKLYDIAVDNHYLVTSKKAKEIGIPNIELVKLSHRGKLERITYGVYRMAKYVPSEEDSYAVAVTSVDENAWLYGESVLELLSLCATNPKVIYVAVNKRIRKQLPKNIQIIYITDNKQTRTYKGIKCQPVRDAIYACIGKMLNDRLYDALINAKEQGYITLNDYKQLKKDINKVK